MTPMKFLHACFDITSKDHAVQKISSPKSFNFSSLSYETNKGFRLELASDDCTCQAVRVDEAEWDIARMERMR